MVSCLDAATGKVLWRKDEFQARPRFHVAYSPLIVDGLGILHLGGQANGAVVAYDLNSGEQKWKWAGEAPDYGSAVLATIAGNKCVVTLTAQSLVGLSAVNGSVLFKTPVPGEKGTTPIVDGQTVIVFPPGGAKAFKIEKEGDQLITKELWSNNENVVQRSTQVLKNGLLYGLSQRGTYFCMNAQDGKTVWTSVPPATDAGGGAGRGGRGGRGGGGGFCSLVDAGSVLLALAPAGQLVVIEPSEKAYAELAKIKVADSQTFAHPVVSGKRLFVQDQNSLTLWVID
jgi:outer membrane protein assembly factor BamB